MSKMTEKEIEELLIREIAVILATDPSGIAPDVSLPSLKIDSLSFVELLVAIERTFNLRLIEMGLTREDFQSVRSLASCIDRLC